MTEKQVRQWHEAYFHWLVPQAQEPGPQTHTYVDLLAWMFAKEFLWFIPNDDNRVQDGYDLRLEFFRDSEAPRTLRPERLGYCTFLEVLLGLSRRLEFVAGGEKEGWAWNLITNLELNRFPDPMSQAQVDKANEIMDDVIWRRYNPDGSGGLFPLAFPEEDQTQIELWLQLAAYVEEIHPEY